MSFLDTLSSFWSQTQLIRQFYSGDITQTSLAISVLLNNNKHLIRSEWYITFTLKRVYFASGKPHQIGSFEIVYIDRAHIFISNLKHILANFMQILYQLGSLVILKAN